MNYEGQICRPPMERASFMLPVAVGCSYNRCMFCTLFKHLKHRVLPLSQVEAELKRVKDAGGNPQRIFLGDGNAFGLPYPHLMAILDMIHRYFPDCQQIAMDATVTNIAEKSDAELKRLGDAGVRSLYLGIESGLDDVLCFMKKDHTLAQAREQIARLADTGLAYSAHMMTGIAGSGRGLENAEATAAFFNDTRPERVINFSLFLHDIAPLYREIQRGTFTPASELENLQEDRRLIELIDVPGLVFDGFHDFLEVRVRGILPGDRERMLSKLDAAIAKQEGQEPVYSYVFEDSCTER